MELFEKIKEEILRMVNTAIAGQSDLNGLEIETDVVYDSENDKLIITITDGVVSDIWTEEHFVDKIIHDKHISVFTYVYDNVKSFMKKQTKYALEEYYKNLKEK